jgi:hypothetical protein
LTISDDTTRRADGHVLAASRDSWQSAPHRGWHPHPTKIAAAAEIALRKISEMMQASPMRKTATLGEMRTWWVGSNAPSVKRIEHLTKNALTRAYADALRQANIPHDSPWRKPGPMSKRKV